MPSPKKIRYLRGTITRTQFRSYAADICVGTKRLRRSFKDVQTAKAWLDAQDRASQIDLTGAAVRDAQNALAMLPDGVSLTQAVSEWLQKVYQPPAPAEDLTMLADMFLGDRAKELRPTTMENYRRVLNHLCQSFGSIDQLTAEALRLYTDDMTAHNKNRTLRAVSAFFGWLLDRNYATANPCAKIRLARTEAPKRQVLTVSDAEHLLRTAESSEPRLVPYVALCLFAGLRPDEAKRLTPADIGPEYIRLTESQTKTAAARTVPIFDNLRQWLQAHPVPAEGVLHGLSSDRFKKNMTALIKRSAVSWANDIMRHSFASYQYERTRDAAATAAIMGHTSTDIFFRHYRGLVTPSAGSAYFAILPLSNPCQTVQ